MRFKKWLAPFIIVFMTIVLFSGCGKLPEKPTGLDIDEQTSDHAQVTTDEKLSTSQIELDLKEEQRSDKDKDESERKTNKKQSDENTSVTSSDSQDKAMKSKSNEEERKQTNKQSEQQTKSEASSKTNQTSERKKDETKEISKGQHSTKKESNKQNASEKNKGNRDRKEDQNDPPKDTTKDSSDRNQPKEPKPTILISVVISSDEIPLAPTELEIEEGDTALDALIDVTKKYKVQMDYRGGQGATAYVEGIGNVYEFDRGPGSGWMFSVNGIFPNRGVGVIPLRDGDRVEFLYTENLGEDLNADLQPFR